MSNAAETPLPNRLAAVATTYTTRPLFQWAAGIGLLVFGCMAVFMADDRLADASRTTFGWICTYAALLFGWLVGLQAKSQFVTPAARLTPGYRAAHLQLVAVLSILTLVAAPLLVASAVGLAPIGTVAIAVCGATLACWSLHIAIASLLAVAMLVSLTQPLVSRLWFDAACNAWPLRLALLALGCWGFFRWLRYVHDTHEERDDYHLPPVASALRRPSRTERAEQRKTIARQFKRQPKFLSALSDRRLDVALRERRSLSADALVRLGLLGSPLQRSFFLTVLLGVLWVAMIAWFGGSKDQPNVGLILQPIFFACFMPGMVASSLIEFKRPLMEQDLLRPMTRDAYFASLTKGYVIDVALQSLGMIALAYFLAFTYTPDRIPPAAAVLFLPQALASNLLLFTFLWRFAGTLSALARIALAYLPLLAVMGINVWTWFLATENTAWPMAVVTALYAAIAVWLARAAHRRWMTVEVG